MNDLGIVVSNWRMLYGHRHGFGRWLPMWVKSIIVQMFNRSACAWTGHNDLFWHVRLTDDPEHDRPRCNDCSVLLRGCSGRAPGHGDGLYHRDFGITYYDVEANAEPTRDMGGAGREGE